ncbi:LPS assembly lipoprotein LptE [Pontiellaceae bacterium B1224]|nr:LPS assembly lipoprotein LptE [Pontiellaceae bacterium B1224]
MNKRLYLLYILTAALLLSGCMGYHLGGSRPEGIHSVTMGPIINNSGEPAIELQVTAAMRQQIQFDGRMKLVNEPKDADAIIDITLINYALTPIAYATDQQTTPDTYRLRVTAEAELRKLSTGKVISTSTTYGEATFPFQSDLTTSKREAFPTAAIELAEYMLDDLIDQWN